MQKVAKIRSVTYLNEKFSITIIANFENSKQKEELSDYDEDLYYFEKSYRRKKLTKDMMQGVSNSDKLPIKCFL